jgi:HlyD family secretion protein
LTHKKGESISSGGTVATLITEQQVAEISLNEVDVAQVEVGQKVTLTYDAIEDLQISGSVAEVDLIGTTNQGVVSYTVTILFDTQDERIKPGMSVSATIITEIKQEVIVVPVVQ